DLLVLWWGSTSPGAARRRAGAPYRICLGLGGTLCRRFGAGTFWLGWRVAPSLFSRLAPLVRVMRARFHRSRGQVHIRHIRRLAPRFTFACRRAVLDMLSFGARGPCSAMRRIVVG